MSEKNILETFLENKIDFQKLETDKPSILIDKSKEIISLEPLFKAPFSIKEHRSFDDLRGFVEYVNDFKTDKTALFAGREKLFCVFDHHSKDEAAWCEHKAEYKIKRSTRWDIWKNAHNVWMDQKSFAEFLDTGLNEITEPKQSEILDLVGNFRATVNYEVDSDSDGKNFTYRRTTKSGSSKQEKITIPEYIKITLEPFDGLTVINPQIKHEDSRIPAYELKAKINWRINLLKTDCQTLEFKIQILNFENAVDRTLESIRVAMKELTGVKVYIG